MNILRTYNWSIVTKYFICTMVSGKSCLKYEMRSYNEMVLIQTKHINEDNQELNYLRNKVVKTAMLYSSRRNLGCYYSEASGDFGREYIYQD